MKVLPLVYRTGALPQAMQAHLQGYAGYTAESGGTLSKRARSALFQPARAAVSLEYEAVVPTSKPSDGALYSFILKVRKLPSEATSLVPVALEGPLLALPYLIKLILARRAPATSKLRREKPPARRGFILTTWSLLLSASFFASVVFAVEPRLNIRRVYVTPSSLYPFHALEQACSAELLRLHW